MTKLEELARVAALAHFAACGRGVNRSGTPYLHWRDTVLAVLEALKEPNEKLRAEGIYGINQVGGGLRDAADDTIVRAAWQAMIDSIIQEHEDR